MESTVTILGGGLAGSEAALQLAARGVKVNLVEMRPHVSTPVHATGALAELVCSNSLKTLKPEKPAGMLKAEMAALGSFLLAAACECRVPAGGALAVDRTRFSALVDGMVGRSPLIRRIDGEALETDGRRVVYRPTPGNEAEALEGDAVIVATGPLTSDALAESVRTLTGSEHLAFYDAAAPIVMADSLDESVLFRQSRYGEADDGDYLNAPFTKAEYERFIQELLEAKRVIARDFETKDLFSACQPIEEIARKGFDAPRYGMMKPVGLVDPRTGRRPYAAVQLRAEDAHGTSYNLVGFQTNLTFPEQARVFRMVPGLQDAEFARYGVMHRNTFIDSPNLLDSHLHLKVTDAPLYFAGQVSGTEGYCEAIMSGLYAALCVHGYLVGAELPALPSGTAFGSLLAYATSPATRNYQPSHVNFGVFPPVEAASRNKAARYAAFRKRQAETLEAYAGELEAWGVLEGGCTRCSELLDAALADAGFGAEPGLGA